MNSKNKITILILSMLMITAIPLALADSDNGKGNGFGLGNGMGIVGLQIVEQVHENNEQRQYNMQEAKEQYKEAKQEFQQNRQEMHQLSEDLESCEYINEELGAELNETETDCEELKENAKETVSNQLDATGNFLLKALEKVYIKIETSEKLDEDVKESLLAKIQENIDILNSELEGLQSNENVNENYLQELISSMKQSWLDLKPEMSLSVALLSNSKIDEVIEKLETSSEMISERINQLESNGYNVTELKLLEEELNEHIISAESSRILAEELLLEFPEEDTTGEIVSQAQEYNQESKNEIHKATSILRDLFLHVRMSEMEMLVS